MIAQPFVPVCTARILAVASRIAARLRRPARSAEVHRGEAQRRVDASAQAAARVKGGVRS